MNQHIKKISVIGDGGWGTTLSIYLSCKGYQVTLWGPFEDYVAVVRKKRINEKFLPGIVIPKSVEITSDLQKAIDSADLIVMATPSKFIQNVLKNIRQTAVNFKSKIFLSVVKGIETNTLLRMSEIIQKELGSNINLAVLSGPNIAREVAMEVPSTAVVASSSIKTAEIVQRIFNSKTFRIYTNRDVKGVELGGSLKNVIAIACGVCDGLGFGTNTKAAILTRGLMEIARLGEVLGAKQKTFFGLSGLGDLATTCFSPQSRNRSVGELLGKGEKFQTIIKNMEMVAEGVETVKAVYLLSKKLKVSMPITTEVYNIIYRNKKPAKAVGNLMQRAIKSE